VTIDRFPDRRLDMKITHTIALGLVIGIALPGAALAKGGSDDDNGGGGSSRETRVAGSCTGGSSAKLKAKPDDGRLEAEFEVDQNRNGVTWRVVIRRNGAAAVNTRATTRAPSGSFSVERRITDGSGSDRITARATSPTGEVCTARLTV
jgi:hypothetical protein